MRDNRCYAEEKVDVGDFFLTQGWLQAALAEIGQYPRPSDASTVNDLKSFQMGCNFLYQIRHATGKRDRMHPYDPLSRPTSLAKINPALNSI
jgi:hypothetical protein